MNFKRIEMYGFKSFADKIEISFNTGITGIVGPNGCGKSNVADAVRWVLGEQSAKTLRGSNMMDVIFSGTEKRKSLSFCEVALIFDNDDKLLPIEFTEVVISRKLYRSGDSEYAINRTPCRLKDVVDLLRDIGIGKEGYSIIGQGKIEEVLSSKPEERRGIFEEACGISKFKARKNETERKLARTHENLLRINDIISELERQVEPLSKQSENAKKYLELKEQLKHHEINYYIYQYDSSNIFKEQILTKLNAINEELNLKQSEYEKANAKYTSCMSAIADTDIHIGNLRDEQLELQVGLEKSAGEAKLTLERVKNLKAYNERLSLDIETFDASLNESNLKIKEYGDNIVGKEKYLKELTLKEEKLADDYLKIIDEMAKTVSADENSEKQVLDSLVKLSDIKSNLSALVTEKKAINERLEEITEKGKNSDAEIKELDNLSKTVKAEITKLDGEIRKLSSDKKLKNEKNAELAKRLKENQEEYKKFETYYTSLQTKEKLLQRLQDSFEGYQYSVRSLLTAAKTDSGLAKKICGTVASLMHVPAKFEVAIDVTLGQTLQNVVVNYEADAKNLIAYLKSNSLGRITFLPVDTVKSAFADARLKGLKEEGFLGVASDLVSFDKKYNNIYTGLLARTAITDTYDNAIKLARKLDYQFKVVSLEGEIIHPHGAITGGSRKAENSSLLSIDRELAEIKNDTKNVKTKIDNHSNSITKAEQEIAALEKEILDIVDKLHNSELGIAVENEKLSKLNVLIKERNSDLKSITEEIDKHNKRLKKINSDLELIDEIENKEKAQKESADDIRFRQKSETDKLQKERDEIASKQTLVKVEIAALISEIKALKSETERLSAEVEEINLDKEQTKALIEDNLKQIESEHKIDFSNFNKTELSEKLTKVLEKLSNLDTYKRDMQTELSKADNLRMELSSEMQRISDKKYKEELNLTKIDTDLEVMKDRIYEEYECDYNGALKYKAADYDYNKGPSEISKLKKLIGALGYVNVNAIEDYSNLRERYDDMDGQRNDLVKAEDDLRKIIAELTKEMLERFTKGFNEINLNFQYVFKELFGGGNAKLILEEPEDGDLLNAGIEIVAEPPEKKLKSISLLSGGERALTAIAILFAILKLRPMPFCVLDEIEAALDDANVDRFARYLQKFSDTTQFIVITHRKPTMELADALYGVTMEEKGVSKIVSVKLSDAIRAAV